MQHYLSQRGGITVKQLKDFVKDLTEVDPDTGDECEVWLEHRDGLTSPVESITALNYRTSENGTVFFDLCISDEV